MVAAVGAWQGVGSQRTKELVNFQCLGCQGIGFFVPARKNWRGLGPPGGASGPRPGQRTEIVDCDANLVGRVIGRGGETIRNMQNMSGARIQIDQNFPQGEPRKITISGSDQTVEMAMRMLKDVMENGPNNTGVIVAADGQQHQEVVPCDKGMVGRLIGHKGETINALQARSGCRIQIDQQVAEHEPRRVVTHARRTPTPPPTDSYARVEARSVSASSLTARTPGCWL